MPSQNENVGNQTPAASKPSDQAMPAKKKTILIVDDDPIILDLMEVILKKAGFQTVLARSGRSGIQKLNEDARIDMALVDIEMPEINGIQLVKMIRNQPALDKIPIMMVTGKSTKEDVVLSFKAGAQDYIVKPVAKAVMLQKICAQLKMDTHDLAPGAMD
ncbi:MAG: response regulator [Nitrospinae bacterium]|nr:response regulator [Nitrospinota bacterium]